jgi:toluene monooxygenase system protein E
MAHDSGDELTRLLLGSLAIDADRCARWSTALARYAIGQRPANRDVLRRWAARWTPRAEAASAGLAPLFGDRSARAVQDAASSARARVLSEAGVM